MTDFPTNKPHVSYSEVRCWKECPYRHKLQYIDKVDLSSPSPYLDFGTNIHEGCENYLNSGSIPKDRLLENIRHAWNVHGFDDPAWVSKQPGWYKYHPVDEWCTWATRMWDDLPLFLDNEFPGWEPISAEEELYEPIPEKDLNFKGFIDAIIKVPRKDGTFKYWILDWKTAKSYGWDSRKKRDILVQSQIILYKSYWCRKNNIPLKDVGCGFVLLKRGAKSGNTCALLKISAGPMALAAAEKMVRNMIFGVKKKAFLKNRNSCTYCDFKDTEHCT